MNARQLGKNCTSMERILDEVNGSQLLVWTGAGEPPIPENTIHEIKNHFLRRGYGKRLGFDCKVKGES